MARLWRLADSAVERRWTANEGVGALVFSPDGRTLGGVTYHGMCHFRDLRTGREITGPHVTKPND